MTPEQLAARWLADVPRYGIDCHMIELEQDADGEWLLHTDALAAIARHLAPGDDLVERATAALQGVTGGPWRVDGQPWNQIVWSGAENRVCFMAHSNGLDDDRDIATARFIAFTRQWVPEAAARLSALTAERSHWMSEARRTLKAGQDALDRAEPAEDVRAGALKEAAKRISELMLPETNTQMGISYNMGLGVAYDAILALIPGAKP